MKLFHMNRKYYNVETGGEGAGGGGGTASGGDPNAQNNIDPYKELWQTKSVASGSGEGGNTDPGKGSASVDPKEAWKNHVQGLNLMQGFDVNDIQQKLQSGDSSALLNGLQVLQENGYKAALSSMQSMLQSSIESAVQDAVNKSESVFDSKSLVNDLHTAHPYTANPAYAPVASAVLTQMMKREGMTKTQAITEVDKYFKNLAKEMGATIPDKESGSNINGSKAGEEIDWKSIMGFMDN